MKTFRKLLIRLTLSGLLTLVLLEVGLAVLCASGRLPIQRPTYCLGNVWSRFWADLNPDFGVWHEPNSTYHHVAPCYNLTYRANAQGMRDRERLPAATGKPRVIVLGDSFMEGWGVASEDRMSDRLERTTGLEHLNFGTSGSFGPTQELLLYKTLAKTFDHDAVILAILPDNDFLDDDYEYGLAMHAGRIRPYFTGAAPDYRLTYLPNPDSASTTSHLVENALRQFTYTGNLIKYVKSMKRHHASGTATDYAGYFDFTPDQWARLAYVLKELRQAAGNKPVLVLTIPCDTDLQHATAGAETPLAAKMRDACAALNMQYLDLLPATRDAQGGWQSCFLTCDRHWNVHGNDVAAQAVLQAASFYRTWHVK